MTESEWLDANARYLSDAIAWVRERLAAHARRREQAAQPASIEESGGTRAQATVPASPSTSAVASPTAVPTPAPPQTSTPPREHRGIFGFLHRGGADRASASPVVSAPAGSPGAPSEASQSAEQSNAHPSMPSSSESPGAFSAAAPEFDRSGERRTPPPALQLIRQRFGLTGFERDVLLLCTAMELDTSIAGLCAQAQGDRALAYPTFALALRLFDDGAWDALAPDRPLRYWRLVEIGASGGSLISSPLAADERIVNFIKGVTCFDDRLAPLVMPLPWPEPAASNDGDGSASEASDAADIATTDDDALLPASQRAAVDTIVAAVNGGANAPGRADSVDAAALPAIWLLGGDTASKRLIAAAAARALGRHAYRLDGSMLPSAASELDALARLWRRESLLLPVALYVEAEHGDGVQAVVDPLLNRLDGLVFVATRHLWPGGAHTPLAVEVGRPNASEQKACWRAASPAIGESLADTLSEQFDLNPPAIRELAQRETSAHASQATAPNTPPLDMRLWDAARALTRPGLDLLARRLVSNATWDDIVLPAAQNELLRQIADQVRHRGTVYRDWGFAARMSRGLGISVLFAGATGTGKTMAAEVLANHLRLDLFRIDLSAVVSKYIGETEANLRRLFDAAEGGGAILFFDEADALFGKRTEVKDSHDRYANIEINYLLQRMESYVGLAILATNMKAALDQAFLRRLRFIVDFQFPGTAEREQMWRRAFPAETPVAGLDYARLARLNLTGGHIAVIAVNAAFQAARAGSPVTMPIVFNAARIEFRKLDRPVNETDFRWSGAVI
ncbi:ATP-binding protein [Burkholderia sp. F1]|uniref:AAA family ATPase n=1 Tax=Burkholderia sp. F1 TaxID=3366817 RepID=UPI003D73D690